MNNLKELLVFVVGDFNEATNASLWNKLFSDDKYTKDVKDEGIKVNEVLTDCVMEYEQTATKLSPKFTYHAFDDIEYSEDKNHAPIDWILCSKNVVSNSDIELVDAYIVTESQKMGSSSVYPSDHFPIVLEVELKNES